MKELKPFLELIAAIVLFALISPIGILYNAGKSIYKSSFKSFLIYWANIVYQIWVVIKFFILQIAVAIDLLGNVTSGEMIEDCVTTEENTLYGKGGITISAATGELEYSNKLNNTGLYLTTILSKVFGQGHCINSYIKEEEYPFDK